MITVLQCILFEELPEEIVHNDVISFIEDSIRQKVSFTLRQVDQGKDPGLYKRKMYAGFYEYYGVAYLTNPELKRSRIAIDPNNKRLIVDINDFPFFEDRDAFEYGYQQGCYTRENFRDVIDAFLKKGYSLVAFQKIHEYDMMIGYDNCEDIPFGEEMSVQKLFSEA